MTRFNIDAINAFVGRVDPPDHFDEGYYHFKWTQYRAMPNAFGWAAQWVAMPSDHRSTRRAFFVNAVVDAEPILRRGDWWITRKAFNEFGEHRDNALSKLRGMLAVAELGESVSDRTEGAASVACWDFAYYINSHRPLADVSPHLSPHLSAIDRAINEVMGW